jgi:peptidyl-tRNA hydrolase
VNPVQYIILNPTLGMSTGKAAAQAAHASIEGLRLNAKETWGNPFDASIVNRWYQGGHYAKVVLMSDDLLLAQHYLHVRGFKSALILDEGRTEFTADLTPTALGLPVLDKDQPHVRETLGTFKLYKDPKDYTVSPETTEKLREELYKEPQSLGRWSWLRK